MRAGHRQEVAAAGRDRVGDELLAADGRDAGQVRRVELGLVGIDRGERLRHGDPIDDGRPVGIDDVRRIVAPGDRDAGARDRVAVAGRLTRVAAADPGARGVGQEERGRGRRAGRADHVDPLARLDGQRRPGGLETAGDLVDAAGHRPAAGSVIGPRPGRRQRSGPLRRRR